MYFQLDKMFCQLLSNSNIKQIETYCELSVTRFLLLIFTVGVPLPFQEPFQVR